MAEMGHVFLAKLGKSKLRPGGIEATNWLLAHGNINKNSKVLEVACNRAKTMIKIHKEFGCEVTGIDLDDKFLEIANEAIKNKKLESKLNAIKGNAMELPFEDNTFDVVINEAMLTMLHAEEKQKALKEYFRVLKPGGILLTQDVVLRTNVSDEQKQLRIGLSRSINANVEPLDLKSWKNTIESAGFSVTQKYGAMTLMSPKGMIKDEGFFRTIKIFKNAMKKENHKMFKSMFNFFNSNKDKLGYVCNVSTKPKS